MKKIVIMAVVLIGLFVVALIGASFMDVEITQTPVTKDIPLS